MPKFSDFEEEVLSRSSRLRFDGNMPFFGLKVTDVTLNDAYLSITFNSIMHKIISFHEERFLTYAEYERGYEVGIEVQKKFETWSYFYQKKLVLEMTWEEKKGVKVAILTPHDKDIIKEDAIFLKQHRKAAIDK
jgi:hypothetical protein